MMVWESVPTRVPLSSHAHVAGYPRLTWGTMTGRGVDPRSHDVRLVAQHFLNGARTALNLFSVAMLVSKRRSSIERVAAATPHQHPWLMLLRAWMGRSRR